MFIPPPERGCLGVSGDGNKHTHIGLYRFSENVGFHLLLGKGIIVGLLGHTTSVHLTT